MNISRGLLLTKLNEASIGLSTKEVLEQSNCFVFKDKRLTTFNDEIMVRLESPIDFDCVVNASDLMNIIAKIPDDDIEIFLEDGEVQIKGKRRSAGISCATEVTLALDAVPVPEKWHRLKEGTASVLQQAAQTCDDNESQYLATVVHVTPDLVEGCDNFRLFRSESPTGFPSEILIPAKSILDLEGLNLVNVAIGQGWVHFKTADDSEVSVRCGEEPYLKNLDKALNVEDAKEITLPANLADIVERAEVFKSNEKNSKIDMRIADDVLTIKSKKDNGWYKEKKNIDYKGTPLEFRINPKFLVDVLKRTRDVRTNGKKMKITTGSIQFVVSLTTNQNKT